MPDSPPPTAKAYTCAQYAGYVGNSGAAVAAVKGRHKITTVMHMFDLLEAHRGGHLTAVQVIDHLWLENERSTQSAIAFGQTHPEYKVSLVL